MANRFKPIKMHVATFSSHFRWPAALKIKTRPDNSNMAQQPSQEILMTFICGVALFANDSTHSRRANEPRLETETPSRRRVKWDC